MLKDILYWTDEKYEQIINDPNEKHPYAKAFGLGCIEGALEGLVIGGVMLIAVGGLITKYSKKHQN